MTNSTHTKHTNRKGSKVIAVPFDARFYFERGIHHFERQQFGRALKYFNRSVQCDPCEAKYMLYVAASYAELGQFEKSNEWLYKVLYDVDANLNECYYYLAQNYAHMGDLEQAEHYVLTYLKREPDGPFSQEAEELLDQICFELERAPRKLDDELEMIQWHERARECLEQGRYVEATKVLKRLIQAYPDFLAARNNLALAYYYLGEWEEAFRMVESVLERDGSNLHALCNLAVFHSHLGQKEKAYQIIEGLKKVLPLHVDHHYKLATTLGILGEDERAYELFSILTRRGLVEEAALYHYQAVAAFNTKRWEAARRAWEKVKKLDPQGEVADYYLEILSMPELTQARQRLPYHYQLPYMEQWRKNGWLANGRLSKAVMHDPLIRSSIFWALKHGDIRTKIQVIQSLPFFADQEVEEALKELLLNPKESDYLKALALFVLRQMGVAVEPEIRETVRWISHWRRVADCLDRCVQNKGEEEQLLQEAYLVWTHFLTTRYPNLPIIRKPEAWAAAVEFVVSLVNGMECSKKELASRYGVTLYTLNQKVKELMQSMALDLEGQKG